MSATILVVEDNAANLELMELLVTCSGHRCVAAGDGIAGIAAAARERPDLILCDVGLPLLDGFGVVAALERDARLYRTPVVAVSALAMVGDRERLLAAGFDGYIGKPIDPEAFAAEIERFLPADLRAERPLPVPGCGSLDDPAPPSPSTPGADADPIVPRDTPEALDLEPPAGRPA